MEDKKPLHHVSPNIEVVKHHKDSFPSWDELKYFIRKYYLFLLIIALIPVVLYSLGQQLANRGSAAPRLNLNSGGKVGVQTGGAVPTITLLLLGCNDVEPDTCKNNYDYPPYNAAGGGDKLGETISSSECEALAAKNKTCTKDYAQAHEQNPDQPQISWEAKDCEECYKNYNYIPYDAYTFSDIPCPNNDKTDCRKTISRTGGSQDNKDCQATIGSQRCGAYNTPGAQAPTSGVIPPTSPPAIGNTCPGDRNNWMCASQLQSSDTGCPNIAGCSYDSLPNSSCDTGGDGSGTACKLK